MRLIEPIEVDLRPPPLVRITVQDDKRNKYTSYNLQHRRLSFLMAIWRNYTNKTLEGLGSTAMEKTRNHDKSPLLSI